MLDGSADPVMLGPLVRPELGATDLPGVAVFRVSGEDRRSWLQGQITQDTRSLSTGGSIQACLCRATGQIDAVLTIFDSGDDLIAVTERPEVFESRAKDFIILEDVNVQAVDGKVATVQGPAATRHLAARFSLGTMDVASDQGLLFLRHDRTGDGGWDVVGPATAIEAVLNDLPSLDHERMSLLALEAGIPAVGVEIDAAVFPPELGPVFDARSVSYRKGCYLGQEVLMRIHSRGHTNRTWRALLLQDRTEPGTEILANGKVVGTVIRAFESSAYGWVASAFLRNEAAEPGRQLTVGGQTGEVATWPLYRLD